MSSDRCWIPLLGVLLTVLLSVAPPCQAPGSQTKSVGLGAAQHPRTVAVMQRLSVSSSEWSVGTHELQTQSRAHGGGSSWRRPAWAVEENLVVEEVTGCSGVRRKPRGRAGRGATLQRGKKVLSSEVRRGPCVWHGHSCTLAWPSALGVPETVWVCKTVASVKVHSRNDPRHRRQASLPWGWYPSQSRPILQPVFLKVN